MTEQGESPHVIRAKKIEAKHRQLAVRRFLIDVRFNLSELYDSGLLAFILITFALAGPIICVSWTLAVWFSVTILRSVGIL